jgi:hypothetical protein
VFAGLDLFRKRFERSEAVERLEQLERAAVLATRYLLPVASCLFSLPRQIT